MAGSGMEAGVHARQMLPAQGIRGAQGYEPLIGNLTAEMEALMRNFIPKPAV
jgi:hypothetical protein